MFQAPRIMFDSVLTHLGRLKPVWDTFQAPRITFDSVLTHLGRLKLVWDTFQAPRIKFNSVLTHLGHLQPAWDIVKLPRISLDSFLAHSLCFEMVWDIVKPKFTPLNYPWWYHTFYLCLYGLGEVKMYPVAVIFVSDNFLKNYLLLPQFFCLFFLILRNTPIPPSWWMLGNRY